MISDIEITSIMTNVYYNTRDESELCIPLARCTHIMVKSTSHCTIRFDKGIPIFLVPNMIYEFDRKIERLSVKGKKKGKLVIIFEGIKKPKRDWRIA